MKREYIIFSGGKWAMAQYVEATDYSVASCQLFVRHVMGSGETFYFGDDLEDALDSMEFFEDDAPLYPGAEEVE